MTDRKNKDRPTLAPYRDYEVGYGKPPTETRFKPGQSGNPNGRPRGSKTKRPGLSEERMKDIILEEAYRTIPIREGDRTVTVPMVQAVMRAVSVNAAKGKVRAQRLFTDLVTATEATNKALSDEWLQTMMQYKTDWEIELERRRQQGITHLPDPIPHPDHVEIDLDNGTARFIGPRTKEEKAAIDAMLQNKQTMFDDLAEIAAQRDATDDPRERRRLDVLWHEKIDFIAFILNLEPKQEGHETDEERDQDAGDVWTS